MSTLLKNYGLKATPQRTVILREITEAGHINVENLYEKVKEKLPTTSLATIYKNVHSLVESNLLTELFIEGRKTMYEIDKGYHVHLICSKCGRVDDFFMGSEDLIEFFSTYIDNKITLVTANIYYICNNCIQ
ncbi:ferric uptake regulator, Fur family [Flexistipes sinusarabici DSM 4947]|uniref:Ferric uptake regulator, Fur family n=3 Tax=Flexistipes sinusarabici TaxID=2352 RepID=F8E884_FLESM|nr:Fur family transcriptional regulator [Flexistipes sinusarabici]AEI15081.1 ferric uptake regulator, Fur family [Flexistipes sinusarabici DSM 4947]